MAKQIEYVALTNRWGRTVVVRKSDAHKRHVIATWSVNHGMVHGGYVAVEEGQSDAAAVDKAVGHVIPERYRDTLFIDHEELKLV